MTSAHDSSSLLETLKQLYSKVMALHAESRARSSLRESNAVGSQDIMSPLSECIDRLAAQAVNNPVGATNPQTPEPENRSRDRATITRDPSSKSEQGELSKHLKNSHKHTGGSLDTGDRLIQSTWEHFHAAIRLARQGDANAARLHMELSNNALNEAAHYLSETEYSRFSKDVRKALKEINDQT